MKYWIKYIDSTGMGRNIRNIRKEWFKTIQARAAFYKSISAAGCELIAFGQVA